MPRGASTPGVVGRALRLVVLVLLALVVVGCGAGTTRSAGAPTPPTIDPREFVSTIDNPYFPLLPGTRWRYDGTGEEGQVSIVVEVTRETKQILGVQTVVVRDTVTREGQVVEDTFDWYAQDVRGDVWYFGEQTTWYEDGKPAGSEGSWEAGRDGAQAGIAAKAQPQVGDEYLQEYVEGEAEDRVEVLAVDDRVTVPFGTFDQVLRTRDFTPLEPEVIENKYYARGIGMISVVTVQGGVDRLELIEMTRSS